MCHYYCPRFGLKTEGQSVASNSSSSRMEVRTRFDRPRRKVPQPEKQAQRAVPVASSLPPPARRQCRPFQPAPPLCPFGVLPPSHPCLILSLPPPLACRGPTQWPTLRPRDTAKATLDRLRTLVGWTVGLTWHPCTTSCQARVQLLVLWAQMPWPATWTSPRRLSLLRATELRDSGSTPRRSAWIIKTKLHRGSWTSMPIAWIIRIKLHRGNSKSCEKRQILACLLHWQ